MLAVVNSAVAEGVHGHPVRVEVSVEQGLPSFSLIGLPDTSMREARDRVRAAIASSGFSFPHKKIIANLTPAELKKHGAALDLAIAVGVLAASKVLSDDARLDLAHLGMIGELGLDGSVRAVRGMVSMADAVVGRELVVPLDGAAEAAIVRPDQVRGVTSLREVVDWLNGVGLRPSIVEPAEPPPRVFVGADLADVRGQPLARYALEVAAAGGHHMLMQGPPGGGKTMLASRLVGLLPPLDADDAVTVTRLHSVSGLKIPDDGLVREPPYRAPHRGISQAALIGGGASFISPGEISNCHGGVLLLDEFGEFPKNVLEALRVPIEKGEALVSRVGATATLPARFQLIAAMNPCPCGMGGGSDGLCRCSDHAIERYINKISSPMLDRFDIHVSVEPPDPLTLLDRGEPEESSSVVRERVAEARLRAVERGVRCNSDLPSEMLDRFAPLSSGAHTMLRLALEGGFLTARGLSRVRTVARTIADLAGGPTEIGEEPIAKALGLRSNVRKPQGRAA